MKPRILLVDDDETSRRALARVLKVCGHAVMEADNGRSALLSLSQQPADVVVTDLVMPEMDGLELITALRGSYPSVKIIAISGGGLGPPGSYLNIARALGSHKTFPKPLLADDLLDAIHELVNTPEPQS